jgi:hypothetical protein
LHIIVMLDNLCLHLQSKIYKIDSVLLPPSTTALADDSASQNTTIASALQSRPVSLQLMLAGLLSDVPPNSQGHCCQYNTQGFAVLQQLLALAPAAAAAFANADSALTVFARESLSAMLHLLSHTHCANRPRYPCVLSVFVRLLCPLLPDCSQ